MEEYDGKLPGERIARYRVMADRAHKSSAAAKAKEVRDMYIAIAMAWDALADEIEEKAERFKLDQTLKQWGPPHRHL